MTEQPSLTPCYHPTLVTFRDPDGVPRIWACNDCKLRFEPRSLADSATGPLDVERLANAFLLLYTLLLLMLGMVIGLLVALRWLP